MEDEKFVKKMMKAVADPNSFGNLLMDSNIIDATQLNRALHYQKENPEIMLGETLIQLGILERETVEALLLQQKVKRGQSKKQALLALLELAEKMSDETAADIRALRDKVAGIAK